MCPHHDMVGPPLASDLEEVRAQYADPQAQLDLVATIAAYNMVSRLLVALQVGH